MPDGSFGTSSGSCGCCGRAMAKAHAVYGETRYCTTCYAREFEPAPCRDCGKQIRTPGGVTGAVCKTCRVKDRTCIRCSKLVPRSGLTVDGGVACPSCAIYFKAPRECAACGQMSLRLSRDFKNGFTEQVCGPCRNLGYINCPDCRKHRRPAGIGRAGVLVCKTCLESDGFICPKCHNPGRRHSKTRCESCYWTDRTEKKLGDAVALLNHEWVRIAFKGFIHELLTRIESQKSALRLERYFLFFARLDAEFSDPNAINAKGLARVFGKDGMRRHSVPFGYLVQSSIVSAPDADELSDAQDGEKIKKLIRGTVGFWYHDLMAGFHDYMFEINKRYIQRGWTGKNRRFTPHTIESNLIAANKFLAQVSSDGIMMVTQLEQIHLERFLANHPGYANVLRRFVGYLNKRVKLFKKLKIVSVATGIRQTGLLPRRKFDELLGLWLAPKDGAVKECLICLLMVLYAQAPHRLVKLKMKDIIRGSDRIYRLSLGKTEIALNPAIGDLLETYIRDRKALAIMEDAWENKWLFPGRARGGHLNAASISYYLKKHDVTAEQLFSTALYNAYVSGLRHPKVLVLAFGITDATAIKYMKLLDPRMRDEIEYREEVDV
jgi:hypothetical protein